MNLNVFYRPLRIMLRDYLSGVRLYPDEVLADGVRTAVQLNKLPGHVLTPDDAGITPDIEDPNKFALLTYHVAKLFVQPTPDRFSFRTRAYAESMGSVNRFLSSLEAEIHTLENGECFATYQNYYSWLHGHAGLPLAEVLTQFDAQAPLWRVSLTADGFGFHE